jgi:hypothetical protein
MESMMKKLIIILCSAVIVLSGCVVSPLTVTAGGAIPEAMSAGTATEVATTAIVIETATTIVVIPTEIEHQ